MSPIKSSTFRSRGLTAMATVLAVAAATFAVTRSSAEETRPVPAPLVDEHAPSGAPRETAILAGGCFWGVQGVFQHVRGVTAAVSGYAGGEGATAQYATVSTGTTGHAEAVRVTFDPHQVSYGQLLQIYFSAVHDPTELNYQGPDHGTQYRSAIFPTTEEQARVARAYKGQLDKAHVYDAALVTTVEPGRSFYPAEAYHQDFLTRHPGHPYIAINDMPKVAALKAMYPALYRDDPVLVAAAQPTN